MSWRAWEDARHGQAVLAVLFAAMVAAAALLLWEGRGLTMFVDEWFFGYLARQHTTVSALLEPDNGHLAVIPILITKASLWLFGAGTVPLRLVAVATHLSIAAMLFVLLRRALGALWALVPVVLFLFLGAAVDVLVGSHAMPIELSVAGGLGAWLTLRPHALGGDVAACALLMVGIASNGFVLPFLAGAAVIVWLDTRSGWRRQWIVAVPLALYLLWRLTAGSSGESDFAISNLAGLPAFAFDSLAAELASVSGLFTEPGGTQNVFQLGPGQALAGVGLVGIGAAVAVRGYRPPRPAVPALVGLLTLWIATGMVASPARQPDVARYIYAGVALLLLLAGEAIAGQPSERRRALALALSGVCALGLAPNLKAIRDGGAFFREQSSQDRAVFAAADLLPRSASDEALLEVEAEQPEGGYADLPFTLSDYRAARRRHGTPAYSLAQLKAADPASREDADLLLGRALPIELTAASVAPRPLPPGTEVGQEGGRLRWRHGCAEFEPLMSAAQLLVPLPPGGLWLRPDPGPPMAVGLRRFGDGYAVKAEAIGGQSSEIQLLPVAAAREWQAQLLPKQPLLVCAVAPSGGKGR